MSSKDASEEATMLGGLCLVRTPERGVPCSFAGVLFSLVHLLLELFRLLLVDER